MIFQVLFSALYAAFRFLLSAVVARGPERWVGTIRRECLDRMLIFSEGQLVRVLAEYETHYNGHRPHRVIDSMDINSVPA